MDNKTFIEELKKLNINIDEKQLKQLEEYYNLLIEWNKKINLTSITDKKQVYLKHFYDSLTITKVIDLKSENTLCDIGTGAGFPGIVLKILFPNLKITLIDSLTKRTNFLKEVIKKLNLKNIEVINTRAEEYSKENRELFDVVTSRAVAPLNILLEYSSPLVKVNKYFIPLKANIDLELENSQTALKKLNCKIIKKEEFNLPIEQSKRTILKILKEQKSNKIFPRKYSEIKKKPL